MKKISLIILIFLCCFLTLYVFNSALALDVGLQQATQTGLGAKDLRVTIAEIIKVSMAILGIVALIIVILSGAFYMISKNDPEKTQKAKKILISALIGLVIILSAYSLANYILIKLLEGTGAQMAGNQNQAPANLNNANQPLSEQPPNYILGDANGDGSVMSDDLNIFNQFITGGSATCYDLNQNVINCNLVLDINGDGSVTSSDKPLMNQLLFQ